MLTRRMILTAAVAAPAAALFTHPAMAAEPAVYSDSGVAIRVADPVAFFAVGEPVFGNAENALM